jgi:hypothetical protein
MILKVEIVEPNIIAHLRARRARAVVLTALSY